MSRYCLLRRESVLAVRKLTVAALPVLTRHIDLRALDPGTVSSGDLSEEEP
jgi:hypothetical protein